MLQLLGGHQLCNVFAYSKTASGLRTLNVYRYTIKPPLVTSKTLYYLQFNTDRCSPTNAWKIGNSPLNLSVVDRLASIMAVAITTLLGKIVTSLIVDENR